MKGLKLFSHSVRMVFGNLKQVFQIGLTPYFLATLIGGIALFSAGLDFGALSENRSNQFDQLNGVQLIAYIIALTAYLVAGLWTIVNWHRFVLLEEYPKGMFPSFHGNNMLSYIGRALLIGVVVFLPLFIIFIAIYAVLMGLISSPILLLGVVYSVVAMLVFFRFGAILPAAAIGEPMKLKEAWAATKNSTGPILISAILLGVVNGFTGWLVTQSFLAAPIMGLLLSLLQQATIGMISVSILTTIYGHFVEGRELT